MAASRGQYPRLIEGVPREGILGEGPHRLAQSVFLLQIPEHILGAVRPVLLLQVPQEDPWGYRERRGRGGGGSARSTPPLTHSPPGLPSAHGPVTSRRSFRSAFIHGLSRRQTPKAGRYSCSGQRLLPATKGAGLTR